MPDVVTAIGAAITLTRQLLDLADATKDAKSKLLIADLTFQLAEVKRRLAELIDENTHFKTELETAKKSHADVDFKDGLYFLRSGDGPFCTACFDRDKKLIRPTALPETLHSQGKFKCPECQTLFGGHGMCVWPT